MKIMQTKPVSHMYIKSDGGWMVEVVALAWGHDGILTPAPVFQTFDNLQDAMDYQELVLAANKDKHLEHLKEMISEQERADSNPTNGGNRAKPGKKEPGKVILFRETDNEL
jgi:hypothetical protein